MDMFRYVYMDMDMFRYVYMHIDMLRYVYMDMDMFKYVYMDMYMDIFRYVYMDTLGKLKWKKVGALTEDGQKYSDYISDMQVYIITVLNIRIRIQRGTNLTKKF